VGAGLVVLAFVVLLRFDAAPWPWVVFWICGLILTAAAPVSPALAFGGYAATFYGTPRYSELFDQLVRSNLLHAEAIAIVFGTVMWMKTAGSRFRVGSSLLPIAVALGVWVALTALLAGADVPQSIYRPRHSPLFFVHAIALLLVASQALSSPAAARHVVVPLCIGLGIRILWQGRDGLMLEGDIGPLAVMVLPLAVWFARSDSSRLVRTVMAGAAIGALAVVSLTYNRAAAVALIVTLALLCWQHRRHVWVLVPALVAIVGAGVWLANSPYSTRFRQAWLELTGGGSGSVTERLALWRAGGEIVADHPIVGVGLGNYSGQLASYAPELRGLVAHNSYVQMAAETGLPGVALYVALFLTALILAARVAIRSPDHQTRRMASALQASLVAYLAAGFFISRHDMVLAYILVGWIAALAAGLASQNAAGAARDAE
jgi:hypothetical protein